MVNAGGIFETVLYVDDLPAAQQFYIGVLGLDVISASGLMVAFATPENDLAEWRDKLQRLDVPIEKEVEWPEGGTSVYFRDPAGNSVELAPSTLWGGGWNFD